MRLGGMIVAVPSPPPLKKKRGRPFKNPPVVIEPPKPKSNAGRKSVLRQHQWEDIYRKNLAGVSFNKLGEKYNLSPSTIRDGISAHVKLIKTASAEIVNAERQLMGLPITARVVANDFLQDLRSMSVNLVNGGAASASTYARIAQAANKKTELLDDTAPYEDNRKVLSEIAEMTQVANEAAKVPLSIMSANKEKTDGGGEETVKRSLADFYAPARAKQLAAK